MYLWFSIDVDSYFNELKNKVEEVKNKIGFRYGTNGLPWHISLKISFDAMGKENDIINDVISFYKTLKPFKVQPKGIEDGNVILWIRYFENDYLTYICKELNKMLNEKYNIPYHQYDLDYIFHTTLFMNDDPEIIKKGYEMLKEEKLPKELYVNKFLIGYSPLGKPETYSVIKEIIVE